MPERRPHVYAGAALASGVPPVSLPDLIRATARRRGDAPALVDAASGETLGYAELDRRIGAVAAGLAQAGLGPGDRLVMYAPNAPAWPTLALAAMATGAAVSGANPQYAAGDLAHQVRDARARFVATTRAGLATVQAALATVDAPVRVVLMDAPADPSQQALDGTPDGALSLSTLARGPAPALPPVAPPTLAALPYSSGTTGLPKGVRLTHRTLVTNVLQIEQVLGLAPDDVVLAFLPMFHIYGFTAVTMCALAAGVKVVTLPRFEPASFVDAIERHRVTRLAVVPPVLQFLASHPVVQGRDLSSLARISSGAAPLSAALEARVRQRLGVPVTQGYGMTESSGVIATTPFGLGRDGASGLLLPGTEARVVDPATGEDVAPGDPGEIWFRGPQAFEGYLDQPEATAATCLPGGWVRTGDIGLFDADGYLFITDRLKELIKVKGFQVAPAELEALLLQHPDVADAAVIGRPDERAGEVPVAWIVARRAGLVPSDVQQWLAERVVDYKQLAGVVVCDAIPRTAAGKILRRTLRERDRALSAASPPGPPATGAGSP